jgi:hypothetical protein
MRVLVVLLVAGVAFVSWNVVSVWLSFRSIERIEVDVDAAREAIAALPDAERPPPPVEGEQEPVEPGVPDEPEPAPTVTVGAGPRPTDAPVPTVTTTTTLPPPDIAGDQLPYDPSFASSPAITDEAFNAFLIIGSDTAPGRGGKRADVIILALLPEDRSAPILVSLPRDLWMRIPCWNSLNRINAALNGCGDAASGPELLAIAVAEFTGIQADHFALFDFEGFKRVIDACGGIEICV